MQVFGEEGEHGLFGVLGIGALESMAGSLEGEEFGFDRGCLESVDDPGGLFESDIALPGSGSETTAVNADDGGKRTVALFRSRHVELKRLKPWIGELNAALEQDGLRDNQVGGTDGEGREDEAGDGKEARDEWRMGLHGDGGD